MKAVLADRLRTAAAGLEEFASRARVNVNGTGPSLEKLTEWAQACRDGAVVLEAAFGGEGRELRLHDGSEG